MEKVEILQNKVRRLKLQLLTCSIASTEMIVAEINRTESLILKAKYESK